MNANLVRQWLLGRGMKRCGGIELTGDGSPSPALSAAAVTATAPVMPFVPVQLPAPPQTSVAA